MKTELRIGVKDGRFCVNGKIYKDLSVIEKEILDKFFAQIKKEMKLEQQKKNLDYERKLKDLPVVYEIVEPFNK